jgi:hypothetical protein
MATLKKKFIVTTKKVFIFYKTSCSSVKEFNEYFQNKLKAKSTTEICLQV